MLLSCFSVTAEIVKARLVGNSSSTGSQYSGRLEVYYNGTWGTVCDHSWGFPDTIVACKEMGFASAEEYYTTGDGNTTGLTALRDAIFTFAAMGGWRSLLRYSLSVSLFLSPPLSLSSLSCSLFSAGPIVYSHVGCYGTEFSLADCYSQKGDYYCTHEDDVGVVCSDGEYV